MIVPVTCLLLVSASAATATTATTAATAAALGGVAPLPAAAAALGGVPRVTIAPGVEMPTLNFGFEWNHRAALKLGVRGLDTALTYTDRQQAEVGAAVRGSGIPREEIFVTSKIPCCPSEFTKSLCLLAKRNATENALHDLKVLGLSYVDLLLVHWPCSSFDETVKAYRALEPLVKSGKARAIGISNFNSSAVEALLPRVKVKPAVNQCGYSIGGHSEATQLWGRDDATRQTCRKHAVHYSAYSPLGGVTMHGTGHVLSDPTVKAVAKAHNRSAAQVALRWVLQRDVVAVTSSDKLSHISSDLAALEFALTDEEMEQLGKVR